MPQTVTLNFRKKIIKHVVLVRMVYEAVSGCIHNREIGKPEVKQLLGKVIKFTSRNL
jgi:hypothetical protein